MTINQIAALAAQAVREVLSAHPVEDPTGAVLGDDHLAHALAHTMLARDEAGGDCQARLGALAEMGEMLAAHLYMIADREDHLAHALARFAMALAQRQLSGNPGEFREEEV
jgi:hypothetical protein